MIFGSISNPGTYTLPLQKLPPLERALAWIQKEGRKVNEPGKHPIEGEMYADVQLVSTHSRTEGTFESHRKFVDVHFCYEGGEIIEWAPAKILRSMNEYNAEKDVQRYYALPTSRTVLHLAPDTFAVFFPGDAHMPKVFDGANKMIRKVVVKVPIDLLK